MREVLTPALCACTSQVAMAATATLARTSQARDAVAAGPLLSRARPGRIRRLCIKRVRRSAQFIGVAGVGRQSFGTAQALNDYGGRRGTNALGVGFRERPERRPRLAGVSAPFLRRLKSVLIPQ